MDLTVVVHSVAEQPITVQALYEGQPIEAQVAGFVMEVVSQDGSCSQTYRARGACPFAVGDALTVTIAKKEAA